MDESKLRHLYLEERLSAKQIADLLAVPENQVVYWLEKYRVPKRSLSEAAYLRINGRIDPFDVKTDLDLDEERLRVAGLLLWVTEGSLKYKFRVYTSNSDPKLINLFVQFLLRICRVEKNKVFLRVMYYPDMELTTDEVIEFWVQTTGLARNQVKLGHYKATHDHRAKSRYGTVTVGVGNIRLRAQMEKWLAELYEEIV